MSNTIASLLQWASGQISSALTGRDNDLVTPRLDAEVLLAHVLGKDRGYLFAWPEKSVSAQQRHHYELLTEQRAGGMPVAYILGKQEFWSLPLLVTPATLIPRPETERLVEVVLAQQGGRRGLRVLDVGTGSGAIALALASENPSWQVDACDISDAALRIARQNAENLGLVVSFFRSDWLGGMAPHSYDVIVSNPPYIAEGDKHLKALVFEPVSALVAEENGLADIAILVRQAATVLKPGGALYVEHGCDQGAAVIDMFIHNGFEKVFCEKDYAGNDRLTHGASRGMAE